MLKNLLETWMIKKEYVIHIRHLNQALIHELVLNIVHAVFDKTTY